MKVEPLVGKQLASVQHLDARIVGYEGAVRSSKTICSLLAWLEFIRQGPDGPLLMVGRTERTLIRNLLDPLVDMLGSKRVRIVGGAGVAYILGRKVYLCGANDERAQEKIRGLSLVGAYADELSTLPETFWTMLLTRLSIPGAKAFFSSNPDGPEHWLKRKYLDKARLHLDADGELHVWPCERCGEKQCVDGCDGDGRLDLNRFSFQLSDNPTLTAKYVQDMNREFSGLHHRRLIKGEWCLSEGVVYEGFDLDRHVLRGPLPPIARYIACGVDYGSSNPTSAVLLGVLEATADRPAALVIARQFRYDGRAARHALTQVELSRRLREWIGDDDPHRWAVDPAADFDVQLHTDGFRGVTDADNSVLAGIGLVASLLATGHLLIHESCTGLISGMQAYSWDDKAAAKGEDKPIKVKDDDVDSLRYVIKTFRPVWRRHVPDAARHIPD